MGGLVSSSFPSLQFFLIFLHGPYHYDTNSTPLRGNESYPLGLEMILVS
jgi:hypothetical protein